MRGIGPLRICRSSRRSAQLPMIQITTRDWRERTLKAVELREKLLELHEFAGTNHHYRPPGRMPPPRDSRKLLPFRRNPGVFSRPFQGAF
jgi:hypothetical protein